MKRATVLICAFLILNTSPVLGAAAEEQLEEFFAATRAGEVDRVASLLEAGVPVDVTDKYGATALIMASSAGQAAVVELLLAKGADPNHTETFYGADPLGMAVFQGHPDVAVLLVKGGADDRAMAFGYGVQEDNEELARAAVESGPFYESKLKQMRMTMMTIPEKYKEMLAQAKSRPDPAPPQYTAADLEPFAGKFEGWDSGLEVQVVVEGEQMAVSINGEDSVAVAVVADKTFRSADGGLEVSFSGRAGEIEGVVVSRSGILHLDTRDGVSPSRSVPRRTRRREGSGRSTSPPSIGPPSGVRTPPASAMAPTP